MRCNTGIDGPPDNATKRVPGALIKPVEKVIEALVHIILRGAIVEVAVTESGYVRKVHIIYVYLTGQIRESRIQSESRQKGERRKLAKTDNWVKLKEEKRNTIY
jgi:hypothetical protein